MLEAYQAYADFGDMMELTEALFAEATLAANDSLTVTFQGEKLDLSPPWQRLAMAEAIERHAGIDVEKLSDAALYDLVSERDADLSETTPRGLLIAALFEQRVEEHLRGPVFITHFPEETSPLCKAARGRPGFIERFEPYALGWEFGNAYTELNDPVRQRQLLELQAKDREIDGEVPPLDDDFLRAVETGLPPTGGLGIGIDRMVMLLTDQASIRDVIAFPTLRPAEGSVGQGEP